MKKKQIKLTPLTLDKETISRLNDHQLSAVEGGAGTLSCNGTQGEAQQELDLHSCCATSCTQNTSDI